MLITVWSSSLIDAHKFINEYGLSSQFVQFVENKNPKGWWIVLRSNSKVLEQLKEKTSPRHAIIW